MTSLKIRLRSFFHEVRSSIAFYPAMLTMIWIVISIVSLQLEDTELSTYLRENLPFFMINDADTARTLLSTFIGGLLGLTVFSFSMVMILLNQASGSFSPRLLPGLITDKTNQLVLGVYIGTIAYCIIVLSRVQPQDEYFDLPAISVLLAILSVLFSVVLFVYFIHNVSLKIRIEHILEDIFRQNHRLMSDLQEVQNKSLDSEQIKSAEHLVSYDSNTFGYFESFDSRVLDQLFELKKPLIVELLQPKGAFIIPSQHVIALNESPDQKVRESLSQAINLEETAYSMTNFENGFQQVVEIIVKAMSPGINDPGTAKDAIDTLTKLLAKRMELRDRWSEKENDDNVILVKILKSFEDLLFEIMAPLRQYCKKDVAVVIKLIEMLSYLEGYSKKRGDLLPLLKKEFDVLMQDVAQSLESERDREVVEKVRNQLAAANHS